MTIEELAVKVADLERRLDAALIALATRPVVYPPYIPTTVYPPYIPTTVYPLITHWYSSTEVGA